MSNEPQEAEAVPLGDRVGCYVLLSAQALFGLYLFYMVGAWFVGLF